MNRTKLNLTAVIAVAAFALGVGFNNIAFSDAINTDGIRIAVVDVNKVVSNSAQVKELKRQQDAKKAELAKWLNNVKTELNKQTTEENKVKLAKKYDAELAKKQEANRADYTKKLNDIDKNITQTINQTAKTKGYDIVFAKSAVLYGGDDITAAIAKVVK